MASIRTQVSADAATVVVREVEANVIELLAPSEPAIVEVITPGPAGEAGIGIPTGGNPGNVLMKTSNANYATEWSATVDGGTFN
jgi:hypothetical protein